MDLGNVRQFFPPSTASKRVFSFANTISPDGTLKSL
jgi:hypothetical protein